MAPLTPSLEVSTELVFCETEALQFGLHQTASLQKSFPVVQATLLRQGHVETDYAAVPRHLNRRYRLKVRGELGPELTNPDTGGHYLDPTNVYTF